MGLERIGCGNGLVWYIVFRELFAVGSDCCEKFSEFGENASQNC